MTSTPDKTADLMELFERIAPEGATFTERQAAERGTVLTADEVDDRLGRVVETLREETGLRTSLSTPDLVAVVRGYYDGDDDATVADALGCSPGVVARARVGLHLFRDGDFDYPFDLAALRRLLDAGVDDDAAAEELGTTARQVAGARRLLAARRDAQRGNHRYGLEFETVLGVEDPVATLRRAGLTDRRTLELVLDG